MDLLNIIQGQLGDSALKQISKQIGTDQKGAASAVSMALPMLIAGLNKNAQSSGGQALQQAIERDHDGSMLDQLSGFLNKGPGASEQRMLGHIFGSNGDAVKSRLGQAAGLSGQGSENLLATLAPIVMAALGKQSRQQGGGGLTDLLGGAQNQLQKQSGVTSLLSGILDGDGDGDVDLGDLTKLGGGLLGKFIK
jgi:hypothetical protein